MAKRIRISNETVNCYGTWVKTSGVDITQYEKNPVLLWMHWRGVIIGCIKDLKVEGEDITGEPYFDEVREESKQAKLQFDKGTLKMASANFDIIETSEDAALLKPGQTRPTVTKSKLIEVSMVDIGGNDDAITLCHDGKELKLANGENCKELPLLNQNDNNFNKQTNKNQMNDFEKMIRMLLGMPETATNLEVQKQVNILLGYKTANEELRNQLEGLKLAGITGMVDEAIAQGKLKAEQKEHFMSLGKTMGNDFLKDTLGALASPTKPMTLLGGNGNLDAPAAGTYKKLSEVPDAKIDEIRLNDKQEYMRLYKAEYGVDYKC